VAQPGSDLVAGTLF